MALKIEHLPVSSAVRASPRPHRYWLSPHAWVHLRIRATLRRPIPQPFSAMVRGWLVRSAPAWLLPEQPYNSVVQARTTAPGTFDRTCPTLEDVRLRYG
jgi:hypothetical protein